jgi:hypothetical protein
MQSVSQSFACMYVDCCICIDKQELITLQLIESNQHILNEQQWKLQHCISFAGPQILKL